MFTNQEQESIHGLSNPRHSIIPKDPGAIVTVKQADLASPILAPDNSAILPLVRDTTSILPVLHRPDVRAPWNQRMAAQPLEAAHILATYGPAKKRLLLFDYDGTLTPIVEDPAKAILSDEAIRSIQTLTSDPRNDVWVISGRSQTFLEQCLGNVSGLGLVAEHGAFVRYPEANIWEDLAQKADMSWQEDVVKIFQSYVDLTPGSRIEKKRVAVVWHFRQANQDFAALQAAECKKQLEGTVAGKYPLDIVNGKCVLEARPTFVNKGQIAQRLIDDIRHSTGKAPNFVLCIGDDATDEDMFRAIRASDLPGRGVYTVTIGDGVKSTDADWYLSDPTEVLATIMMLNNSDLVGDVTGEGGRRNDNSPRHSQVLPMPRSYLIRSDS